MITANTKELRKLVAKAGFTQNLFAEKIGVSQGFASLVLKGKRGVSAPTAKSITEVLGCDFDRIFDIGGGE